MEDLTAFSATWQACAAGFHTVGKKRTLSDQGFLETEGHSGRTLSLGIVEIKLLLGKGKE